MIRTLLAFTIGVLLLGSCTTYSEEQKEGFDARIEKYLKKKGIECERSSSGLYYKITPEGEGDLIKYKDHVVFKYKGWLLNGKVFDEKLNEPVEFAVEELIGAWKEAVQIMRKGDKAFLVAPPQLGYGEHQLNDIPPNSILVFELEIIDVK